jgi:hypothetical protein
LSKNKEIAITCIGHCTLELLHRMPDAHRKATEVEMKNTGTMKVRVEEMGVAPAVVWPIEKLPLKCTISYPRCNPHSPR